MRQTKLAIRQLLGACRPKCSVSYRSLSYRIVDCGVPVSAYNEGRDVSDGMLIRIIVVISDVTGTSCSTVQASKSFKGKIQ